MIATTISSSISVNPLSLRSFITTSRLLSNRVTRLFVPAVSDRPRPLQSRAARGR
jgi:hypothetical protein